MQDKFISVTVLNQYIHDVFVAEEMLRGITLCGEVSGLRTSGGHAYFVMKDANAQVQCCCFRYAKTYLPKEGETVLAKGSVDYYAKGGRLSFNIDEIKPFGEGFAALKLAQLKQRLLEEGYFDDSHKVAIPEFCSKICVLTSASGAVIRDIVTTVRKVNNVIDIVVRDIPVQGAACADAVVRELAVVDKLGFDAIVIARGRRLRGRLDAVQRRKGRQGGLCGKDPDHLRSGSRDRLHALRLCRGRQGGDADSCGSARRI